MTTPLPSRSSRDLDPSQNYPANVYNCISISSDELQDHEQQLQVKRQQDDQFKQVTRPVNKEEQARNRELKILKAIEELNSIQMKKKEYSEVMEDVAAKMENKRQAMKLEKQLKKEFQAFSFLPISALKYVKSELTNFDKYCLFEPLAQQQKAYMKMRQDFRRLLTRGMMLSIQQIRQKIEASEHTELEQKLLSAQTDTLKYCYMNAGQMQRYFFVKLRKNGNNRDMKYQKQMKLILREYSDKNNMELRRNIINKKITFKQLATATDESIKCQKTKEEEKEKLIQIVRQSQKDPFALNRPQEESQQFHSRHSNSQPVPKETSRQQPVQTLEQKNMREKKELNIVLHNKFKKCQQSFKKQARQIIRRQDILKQAHSTNDYFFNLCRRMQI